MSKKFVQTLVRAYGPGTYTMFKGAFSVAVNNNGATDIEVNGGTVKAGEAVNLVAPEGWRLENVKIYIPATGSAAVVVMRPLSGPVNEEYEEC